ncbi:MAG: membrane protein insertase YidC, partial [Pseudomonadota bacterium]
MQPNEKMHPDDKRNLIIFGVLSILLWLSYDHFILAPKLEQMRAAQEIAQANAIKIQTEEGMMDLAERSRADIVAEANGKRIPIDNKYLKGSLNPVGARLDDLVTKDHYETVAREKNAVLLSPKGSFYPKYIEHGWVAADDNIKVPDSNSVWAQIGGDQLSADKPITLQWNNGQGLTFENVISLDNAYGFTIIKRVINNTAQDITLYPYSLISERGTPKDFEGRWVVHEGPIAYVGKDLYEATYNKMDKKPTYEQTADNGWIGLTSKSWLTTLVPKQGEKTKFRMTYTKGVENALGVAPKDRYQADTLGPAQIIPTGGMISHESNMYVGAKKLSMVNKYRASWNIPHFDLVIDWGWFFFLTKPFFYIINFFYGLVGNFGVAIILFTVVLRLCVFPLANTSFKSFANMRKIGPEMNALRDKYKDDKAKLQQELVKLYQKEKVNPMAGCLPILIQIPIFFSLFKVLSNTIEMRHAPFFGWIQDLSAPDPTSIFNLFGLLPFTPPGFLMIGIWPCLMLLTMIIQRKLSPPPADKIQANMIAAMPWVMTFILAHFAAGLVIYWTFNNLFSVIQQYIIMTRMGVKVDLIGNILGKNKPEEAAIVEGEEAEVEESTEEKNAQEEKPKKVSKPKPKKS